MSGLSSVTFSAAFLARSRGHAAAGHDAFFHCSASGVQGVIDAVLAFFHFNFGDTTDLEHGNTAGQLGHTLLQFFTVVVRRGRVFDLRGGSGCNAAFDGIALLEPAPSMMVVFSLVDLRSRLASAQVMSRVAFLQASGPLLQKSRWPPVRTAMSSSMALRRSPKPGALTAATLTMPRMLVHNQGGQRFAFHIFCHDQQRAARLWQRCLPGSAAGRLHVGQLSCRAAG